MIFLNRQQQKFNKKKIEKEKKVNSYMVFENNEQQKTTTKVKEIINMENHRDLTNFFLVRKQAVSAC